MKTLTVWQPWAGALAIGAKEYETRSWATNYRGPIAIHSAKKYGKVDKKVDEIITDYIFNNLQQKSLPTTAYWHGCILATAELVDCIKITPEFIATLSPRELILGDYTLGRYAWKLENLKTLPEPIPAKGKQGLWNWEGEIYLCD